MNTVTRLFVEWRTAREREMQVAEEEGAFADDAWKDKMDLAKEQCDSAADEFLMAVSNLNPDDDGRETTLGDLCRAIGR